MTKKDLTCGGSHKGAKFAHITKVHVILDVISV